MRKVIAVLLAVFALAGTAAVGAGWTWDEDAGSTIIAGPHEGSGV